MATVAGVWVVLMTVEVQVPQASTFPPVAPSQRAHPMMVDEPAVQAANVIAFELVLEPAAAALISAAATDFRAYPV